VAEFRGVLKSLCEFLGIDSRFVNGKHLSVWLDRQADFHLVEEYPRLADDPQQERYPYRAAGFRRGPFKQLCRGTLRSVRPQ